MNKIKISDILSEDIINEIDNIEIDENDIEEFRNRVKQIDKKLKENLKPKTITISKKVHSKIKKYCNELNLNIGEFVSETILNEINSVIIEEPYEDNEKKSERISKNILEKYDSILYKGLYKTNKLIVGKGFEFVGYSKTDGFPIYEVDNIDSNIIEIEINNIVIEKVKSNEVSKDIKSNIILDCFLLNKSINITLFDEVDFSTKITYE